jgi:hypothetical protein
LRRRAKSSYQKTLILPIQCTEKSSDFHSQNSAPSCTNISSVYVGRRLRASSLADRSPSGRQRFGISNFLLPLSPDLGYVFAFQAISGLASGTFIPLAIGFVVQNLPAQLVIYGVACGVARARFTTVVSSEGLTRHPLPAVFANVITPLIWRAKEASPSITALQGLLTKTRRPVVKTSLK